MSTKVISHKSAKKTVNRFKEVLETGKNDGIKHTWSGFIDDSYQTILVWNFDWDELNSQGFDRLVGYLTLKCINDDWNHQYRIDIDWFDTKQSISRTVAFDNPGDKICFEYSLTAHSSEMPQLKKMSFDEMFAASDKTDAILIVEGKKLNVNKSFLSFHSDYFSTLFSSNFKEGQMKEIEIKEVSYEDFGLLLSTIYPMQVFPNDETAEKLLELADRFLMPSVKHLVEHHLLDRSKIQNEKMMMLGDQYGIKSILERSICRMDSVEKMKKLEKSPEFEILSVDTVAKLFKRILKIV
ncbi:hypothetical protein B9Z55_006910 [Caenorhabditis nigoni]|uniref:BTB domain-containing protein n=1 Tax=Caenorhabditis nigoni TaxID=1611254 RepID=A0A2G5V742_9PELO|nr:hypothetical protein B9Z55_006910 [Caenorhabditis nigoni]